MSVFVLKLVIISTMLLDHIMAVLGSSGFGLIPYDLFLIGRGVGRMAFLLVCFMIANGVQHSHDRKGYLLRMMQFAVLSQIPFCMVFYPTNFVAGRSTTFIGWNDNLSAWWLVLLGLILASIWRYFEGTKRTSALVWGGLAVVLAVTQLQWAGTILLSDMLNVFYTLGVGLFAILCLEALQKKQGAWYDRALLVVTCLMSAWLFGSCCDYGYNGMVLIVLLYLCYQSRLAQCICLAWFIYATYYLNFPQLPYLIGASVAILLVALYRDKLGRYQLKWFFYWFYPIHLLVLGLVSLGLRLSFHP